MISGQLNPQQLAEAQAMLQSLDLPPKKRQRLLWRIAKHGIIAAARRHQRNQRAPDGTPWAPRKNKKKKAGKNTGKMLKKLPRLMAVREIPGQDAVKVYFRAVRYGPTASASNVAWAHHNGATIRYHGDSFRHERPGRSVPCSLKQAQALRAWGLELKSGKRWRKATLSMIRRRVSNRQAGWLLARFERDDWDDFRDLYSSDGQGIRQRNRPRTWTITLPSRVFLGVTNEEFSHILARQINAMGYGLDVDAQDIR
ncbi:phage virion morphogenesis protein [Escherichia coli]